MGEYADYIINGDDCQECGEHIGDGPGYPRSCAGCKGNSAPDTTSKPKKSEGKRRREKRRKKRLAARRRETLNSADKSGWTQLSPTHFRKVINGRKIDWWPSTDKWMAQGKVSQGGVNEYIQKFQNGEIL